MTNTTLSRNILICSAAATMLLIILMCVFIISAGNHTEDTSNMFHSISIDNSTSQTLENVKIVVNYDYALNIDKIDPFSTSVINVNSESWAKSVVYSIYVSGTLNNGELFRSHFYEQNPDKAVLTAFQDENDKFYISSK